MTTATGSTVFLRAAGREAAFLLVISILLGSAYNAITRKGIFSSPSKSKTAATSEVVSPEIIPLEVAKAFFDKGALFVDSRHAYDFSLGHVKGAMNIPLQEQEAKIAALDLPLDRTLVVYCDGADCNSSLEIGSKLSIAGYRNVKVFFNGWQAWTQAGFPMETGKP